MHTKRIPLSVVCREEAHLCRLDLKTSSLWISSQHMSARIAHGFRPNRVDSGTVQRSCQRTCPDQGRDLSTPHAVGHSCFNARTARTEPPSSIWITDESGSIRTIGPLWCEPPRCVVSGDCQCSIWGMFGSLVSELGELPSLSSDFTAVGIWGGPTCTGQRGQWDERACIGHRRNRSVNGAPSEDR